MRSLSLIFGISKAQSLLAVVIGQADACRTGGELEALSLRQGGCPQKQRIRPVRLSGTEK
jgi:hypothetical protein